MQIIIATHGNFAKGLLSAVEMQCGKRDNITAIAAYSGSDDFETVFLDAVDSFDQSSNIVVLTDLLGGSVNQVAMRHCMKRKLHIVSGVNLATVIKVVLINDESNLGVQLSEIVEESKEQLIFINGLFENS